MFNCFIWNFSVLHGESLNFFKIVHNSPGLTILEFLFISINVAFTFIRRVGVSVPRLHRREKNTSAKNQRKETSKVKPWTLAQDSIFSLFADAHALYLDKKVWVIDWFGSWNHIFFWSYHYLSWNNWYLNYRFA